jgi:hypothetical protein
MLAGLARQHGKSIYNSLPEFGIISVVLAAKPPEQRK